MTDYEIELLFGVLDLVAPLKPDYHFINVDLYYNEKCLTGNKPYPDMDIME